MTATTTYLSTPDRCPHYPAPHPRHSDSRLTRRECAIAALAADGMSNREIAVLLFISVRTVENHLQRIYTKLGIHSRLDLRGAAGAVLRTAG
ncbi:helix-turn-helix domain-containing protein [Nocardia sp. CA-107356]|uniref:helix-turn-helix domain-containing protein n=1 Tax=Nocardia sp. CA-107356 TaxID=3239972 RepID=UPI003D8F5860